MAYSAVGYTGDGVTKQFAIPFEYLSVSEVFVYSNNVILKLNTDYVIVLGVLTMVSAPVSGVVIKIYRRTDLSKRKVEWKAKGSFTAADQNLNAKQLFFICQELSDKITGAITGDDVIVPIVVTDTDAAKLLDALSLFLINHTTTLYP